MASAPSPRTVCAACGEPGHRYGRNEGMDRYDPMACINLLRGKSDGLAGALRAIVAVHPESGTSRLEISDWADALDRAQAIARDTLDDLEVARHGI